MKKTEEKSSSQHIVMENIKEYRGKVISYIENELWIKEPFQKLLTVNCVVTENNKEEYNNSILNIKDFMENKEYLSFQKTLLEVYNKIFDGLENGSLDCLLSSALVSCLKRDISIHPSVFMGGLDKLESEHIENHKVQEFLINYFNLDVDLSIDGIINGNKKAKKEMSKMETSYINFSNKIVQLMYGESIVLDMVQRNILGELYENFIFRNLINPNSKEPLENKLIETLINQNLEKMDNLSDVQLERLSKNNKDYLITYLLTRKKGSKERLSSIEVLSKVLFSLDLDEDSEICSIFYVLSFEERNKFKELIKKEALNFIENNGDIQKYKSFLSANEIDLFKEIEKISIDNFIEKKLKKEGIEKFFIPKESKIVSYHFPLNEYLDILEKNCLGSNNFIMIDSESLFIKIEHTKNRMVFCIENDELINLGENKLRKFMNSYLLELREVLQKGEAMNNEVFIREFLLKEKLVDKPTVEKNKSKI